MAFAQQSAGKAGTSSAKEDSHFVQSEVYLADGDEEEYWGEEDVDQYENDWWQEDGHDDYYEDEEAYYGSQDYEFDDEGEYDEEEYPEELKEASKMVEESYLSCLDARRKMREIATSRAFYPIFAIADTRGLGGEAREGRPKGKGKGKRQRSSTPGANGRRKGKSKGKSKSPGRRLPSSASSSSSRPGFRRFGKGKGKSALPAATPATGSTSSGSTQQHGPRFKRFRRATDGTEPASDESACLCTLIEHEEKFEDTTPKEGCEDIMMTQEGELVAHAEEAHDVEPEKCIADSGCTSAVMGEETWKEWLPRLRRKGLLSQVSFEKEGRQFKFGNGNVLNSTRRVRLPVRFYDEDKVLEISLVPGATPLLLAKKTMSDWGVVQDFRHAKILLVDREDKVWRPVEIGAKGYFLFNLFNGFPDVNDKDAMYIEDERKMVMRKATGVRDLQGRIKIPSTSVPFASTNICRDLRGRRYLDERNSSTSSSWLRH
jgi:hypothetical protein